MSRKTPMAPEFMHDLEECQFSRAKSRHIGIEGEVRKRGASLRGEQIFWVLHSNLTTKIVPGPRSGKSSSLQMITKEQYRVCNLIAPHVMLILWGLGGSR